MSGRTYEKAKAIVEAAERDPALRPLVARMDAEGKVDRVYRELQSRQPRPKPAAKAAPQQPPPPALDRLRCPVPPNLVPLFAEAGAAPELIASVRALNEVLGRVRGLLRRVPLVHLDGERFERLLREAAGCLADASPHCVCRDCEGKGCRACGGNGYWTRAEAEKRGVY